MRVITKQTGNGHTGTVQRGGYTGTVQRGSGQFVAAKTVLKQG